MRTPSLAAAFLAVLLTSSALNAQGTSPPPVDLVVTRCDGCAEWNEPQRPFRLHGNTWYVGTRGLSAILVTSSAGHVLIDGGLPESAPLIAASVRALGFRLEDVKVLLNSHAHYDHAGGLAALQRASGADVLLHPWSARLLRLGTSLPEDPQYGLYLPFPGLQARRELSDRDVVRVGDLAIIAHFTGGHTPGGTSFSWRSCEGTECRDVVYADSQTPIAEDGFRFSSNTRYPTVLADFERGHARLESLPCDLLLAPHPGAVQLFERLARRDAGEANALREPNACRTFVRTARERLAQRLTSERTPK
ncbi:MAG: subclass B3 metallo-beta-lactamase [Gemmatimonadaceae bacterium]|jgi:metallo-beta-lactamase class B|nr:subclass B3 metallo-beta-lactamase [Gemmatimonadaceae bacterium]